MSKSYTAKNAWRKKKYRESGYEKKRYERERSRIEEQQRNFATLQNPEEIVKVRMMSTPEKIDNFKRMLELCQEIGMCEVMNFSDIFPNRDTNRYFRAYSEVIVKEGVDNE